MGIGMGIGIGMWIGMGMGIRLKSVIPEEAWVCDDNSFNK